MKFRFAFIAASLLNLLAMTGCNGVGDKDSILARIDKEVVYREDLVLLMKNSITSKEPLDKRLYEDIYAKEAVVSKALAQYPELNKAWEEDFQSLETRLLVHVYQHFYLGERLAYSEQELRQFYEENRNLFKDAPLPDFGLIQGVVASEYYMARNKDSLNAYLEQNLKGSTSQTDTLNWKTRFVEMHRVDLQKQKAKSLADELHVTFHQPPKPSPEEYFAKHKDMFMTAPGYELYHVQGKDSLKLIAEVGGVADLEQFKKIAVLKSVNGQTAKDSGFVGYVKRDFALPYGIGMVSQLGIALEGKNAGFVTPVIKADNGGDYHVFYLSAQIPPKQKEFERVAGEIQFGLESGELFDVDSSFVLVSKNGKPLMTEGDFIRISADRYLVDVNGRNRRRLFGMIVEGMLYSEAALSLKLDKTWEYRALVRAAYRNYINDEYFRKNLETRTVSDDSLKSFFNLYGNPVHPEYAFEQGKKEVWAGAIFPMNILKHEFLVSHKAPFDKDLFSKKVPTLFMNSWREQSDMENARLAAEYYESAVLHFYDSSIPEFAPEIEAGRLLVKADSLRNLGRVNESVAAYRKVMFAYGENDSLFKKAVYETAQIFNEADRFNDAEVEYLACYEMFPDSPEAEKAMFSRGFILSENLNRNDEALTVLKQFQQKYPQSELKESVDWLVQNIESNGKLADDLIKKISAEE